MTRRLCSEHRLTVSQLGGRPWCPEGSGHEPMLVVTETEGEPARVQVCGKCGGSGHNRMTCKQGEAKAEKAPPPKRVALAKAHAPRAVVAHRPARTDQAQLRERIEADLAELYRSLAAELTRDLVEGALRRSVVAR